jgi:hypothetical protein
LPKRALIRSERWIRFFLPPPTYTKLELYKFRALWNVKPLAITLDMLFWQQESAVEAFLRVFKSLTRIFIPVLKVLLVDLRRLAAQVVTNQLLTGRVPLLFTYKIMYRQTVRFGKVEMQKTPINWRGLGALCESASRR